METTGTPPTSPKKSSGWTKALWSCLIAFAVLLIVMVVSVMSCGKAFLRFGISSNFGDYIRIIRKADLDEKEKREVIEKMERLRDRARDGDHVGFVRWMEVDESIRSLIDDGDVTEYDLKEVSREMDNMERKLD
jgi:hypothetical protein